jgi:hypothetical protein
MRAVAVLLAATQIYWLASAASAETQVNAEDCSSAVSGTVIGSHIEIHCLSKEDIERVVDELVRQGVVKRAEDAGIETSVIVSLAARLKPARKLDFAQAVVEVSHAVDIAIGVANEGSSGSSDQFVDEVLKRIADKTKANDPSGATREAEDGFARWEKQEAGRRANATAAGVTLLEAALKTDLLRFDAAAAAGRVEKVASLQHEDNPKALFDAVRARQHQFDAEGNDKGINFSLQVAIAIARREAALAQDADQRGVALNDLGVSLAELGERQSGREKLAEAVASDRAALEERKRERVPLDWAESQNNLGSALWDSASGRAERRGSRRRFTPIALRWRSARANGFRSIGRRHREASEMRSASLASGRAGRRGWRRRSPRTAPRSKS